MPCSCRLPTRSCIPLSPLSRAQQYVATLFILSCSSILLAVGGGLQRAAALAAHDKFDAKSFASALLLGRILHRDAVTDAASTRGTAATVTTPHGRCTPYAHTLSDLLSMASRLDATTVTTMSSLPQHTDRTAVDIARMCHLVPADADTSTLTTLSEAFDINNFGITELLLTVSGAGVYPAGALLNHSCAPNCVPIYTRMPTIDGAPIQLFRAICDVTAGSELTHSYTEIARPRSERRARLFAVYGFHCSCALCSDIEGSVHLTRRRDGGDLCPLESPVEPSCNGNVNTASLSSANLPEDLPANAALDIQAARDIVAWLDSGGSIESSIAKAACIRLAIPWRIRQSTHECGDLVDLASVPLEVAAIEGALAALLRYVPQLHLDTHVVTTRALDRYIVCGDIPSAVLACIRLVEFYKYAYQKCPLHPQAVLQQATLADLLENAAAAAAASCSADCRDDFFPSHAREQRLQELYGCGELDIEWSAPPGTPGAMSRAAQLRRAADDAARHALHGVRIAFRSLDGYEDTLAERLQCCQHKHVEMGGGGGGRRLLGRG